MLKTILFGITCSAVTFATVVYSGRTVHSSQFQLDIPYYSAIKTTPDPANIWSWHHDFACGSGLPPITVNALVDFDGNGVMDTENVWLRVVVTDLEIVGIGTNPSPALLTISDGTSHLYSAFTSVAQRAEHVALATPIVLPVGSQLQVTVDDFNQFSSYQVNLIGRIVNL